MANFRVTHVADLVPNLPSYALGFAHVSPEYWITSAYGANVTTSDIQVSYGAINTQGCESKLLDGANMNDHGWYFGNVAACLG